MKNSKILFFAALAKILFYTAVASMLLMSCKDETGIYVEQLYTDAQKDNAVKECLRVSIDSASNHLFVTDGFYANDAYRIDFKSLQNTLFDTLKKYGDGNLSDSLVLYVNKIAENCGAQIPTYLKHAVDTLKISDYDALLNGSSNEITEYFRMCESGYLKSAFASPVSIRMDLFGANEIWNKMLEKYYSHTSSMISFDIQSYIVDKILDDILIEMAMEENLIRTDTNHQNSVTILLGKK